MQLNRTKNELDREARNNENQNWEKIEKIADDISGKAFDQLVDKAKLIWKEPVNTFEDLPSNAEIGETRQIRSTGKVYRWDGTDWNEIQQIDAGPVNEVDTRLTNKITTVQNEIENASVSHTGTNYNNLKERLDKEHQEVTSQLAQKAYKMTELREQGVAFDTSHDPHVSWLHCNVSYDEEDDSFFIVYNGQPTHSITQSKVYARKKPTNGDFGDVIIIADRLHEGISAKCQSSGIAANGDYLAIVAHINSSNGTILGTFVYRSTDKGLTWDSGTELLIEGEKLIAYSGDVSGFRTLTSGRIILWGWYQNKQSFAIYSDDNGYNWHYGNIKGSPIYNVTEPTFIELDDGTVLGYARDDVTDGNDHISSPKPAWFLQSFDGGITWEVPVKSKSILDMSNNNCAFIKHGDLIEIIFGSRFLHEDKKASIYQAITTQEDFKNDTWSQPVRIARVNGIPAHLTNDGDSGYYGAATAKDGTSLVFYYNGTKKNSKIYYLKGNYNANVYNDVERNVFKEKVSFDDADIWSVLKILGTLQIGSDTDPGYGQFRFTNKASNEIHKTLLGTMYGSALPRFQLINEVDGSIENDILFGIGAIVPFTDKTIDIGSTTRRFGAAYFTGVVGSMAVATVDRPTTGLLPGVMLFDRTLNKPIWRNANNDGWVDAMGNPV